MDTKCAVCNEAGGHVTCDGCGRAVCFNCFHFVNSRKLCLACVAVSEEKRRWQMYAEQYSKMTEDERAGVWATLSPEERSMLEAQLMASSRPHDERSGKVQKHAWLVLPILLGCVLILLLVVDTSLLKQASVAGEKIESEVGSLAASVRGLAGLTSAGESRASAASPQSAGPIELIGQTLRENGLPITAGNLRMKDNPAGEGTIVYSPHYLGPNRRLAWMVIDGQAYSLTEAARDLTPSLRTSRTAPAPQWKKTGLSRERALRELQSSFWE